MALYKFAFNYNFRKKYVCNRPTVNSTQTIRQPVLGIDGLVDGRRVAERVGLVHWISRQRLQRIEIVIIIYLLRYTCTLTI